MKFDQEKRMKKITNEPFYLLDLDHNDKGNYVFNVSGSTANIYTTTLYPGERGVFCSCPDARSHAKKQGCVCKHVCFIMIRVLKISLQSFESELLDNDLYMSNQLLQEVETKFQQLKEISQKTSEFVNQEFVNQEYAQKYQKIKEQKNPTVEEKAKKYDVKKQFNEDEEEPECMICFDIIEINQKNTVVECPLCHNLIHKQCMEKWLKSGKKNCIYCRSSIWSDYYKDKNTNTEYKNLLTT